MFPWLEKPWKVWLDTFNSGRVPNSIIVSGADGLGKKTFARNMGSLFLCEDPKPDGYCGKCHSCLMLADGTHPDALIIGEGENSTISIDAVRKIGGLVSETPRFGVGKLVIIYNAENMSEAAANALLKVLEEPVGRVLFILTTDDIHRLLPTVLSRSRILRVDSPDFESAKAWMYQNISGDLPNLRYYYRLCGSSPVQTLHFVENDMGKYLDALITSFREFLGDPSAAVDVLDAIDAYLAQAASWLHDNISKPDVIYRLFYFCLHDVYARKVLQNEKASLILGRISSDNPLMRLNGETIVRLMEDLQDIRDPDGAIPSGMLRLRVLDWLNRAAASF